MARDFLKAWIFGLVFSAVILGIEFVGTHTPLEAIAFPFVAMPAVLASLADAALTRGRIYNFDSVLFTGLVLLAGSLLYGLAIFFVLRFMSRKRREQAQRAVLR